ncbi:hypothetical protein HPP92_013423 [Vanilla planifolia]|uniref:Uncharacterized protein n=1 Tax=Vanilla planifolia TaxID=51239 RepID=A0A835UYD6_VANPL|nr:hypothetical protein HPP92_013851 [Vanilla planifolia]KAG0478704.1 hypothetical protein HPP92_013423 [Vanilla planifolia]
MASSQNGVKNEIEEEEPESLGRRGTKLKHFQSWIKSPRGAALFVWLTFVAAGLLLLVLLMTGLLNGLIPSTRQRDEWEETVNQILNALFTLMALYEHPKFLLHLVLLLRWRPGDEAEPRKAYTKNGALRPNERAHLLVGVVLLHVACFAQYVLCGLYWSYPNATRPAWAVNLAVVIGTAAPVIAVVYIKVSPSGKRSPVEQQSDVESKQSQERVGSKIIEERIAVRNPQWNGGLFDCRDEGHIGCLSFFCTFCLFGWNMERLGFGNMVLEDRDEEEAQASGKCFLLRFIDGYRLRAVGVLLPLFFGLGEDGFDRMMKVYKGWPEFVPSTRKGCLSSTEIERTGTLAHIEVLTDMQRETESSDAAKVPAFQRISKEEDRPLGSVELAGEAPKVPP